MTLMFFFATTNSWLTVTFPLTSCTAISLVAPSAERLKCQESEEKIYQTFFFFLPEWDFQQMLG